MEADNSKPTLTFRQLREGCRVGNVALLTAALDSGEEIRRYPLRAAAARHLGHLQSRESVPELLRLLRDQNVSVRTAAAIALGHIGDSQVMPRLLQALDDPHPSVRARVIGTLGEVGDPRAIPKLVQLAQSGGWIFQRAPALYALAVMPDDKAQEVFRRLLARERFLRRRSVLRAARKFIRKRGRLPRHRLI